MPEYLMQVKFIGLFGTSKQEIRFSAPDDEAARKRYGENNQVCKAEDDVEPVSMARMDGLFRIDQSEKKTKLI